MLSHWAAYAVFLAFFAGLFAIGLYIYRVSGWKAARILYLAAALCPVPLYGMDTWTTLDNMCFGFEFAHGTFFCVCLSVWAVRCFIVEAHKDEYEAYLQSKFDLLPPPTEEDLMEVKRKTYVQDAAFNPRIGCDIQRNFLLNEWTKMQKSKIMWSDPFKGVLHLGSSDDWR